MLVPKKRGAGFLKTPYGHHHNLELSRVESMAGCDLWGLDGSLDFQVSGAILHGGRDGQLAFSSKVMPLLELYYGVPSREIGVSDFWRLHPMMQDEMESWLAGTEATYRAMDMPEREAKEKAMQD